MESGAKDRVIKIGTGLVHRGDTEEFRGRAATEFGELRKNEPHPVTLLGTVAEFRDSCFVTAGLGVDEPFEIEGICVNHPGMMTFPPAVGKSGWRY